MATPAVTQISPWFNYEHYMDKKLLQVQDAVDKANAAEGKDAKPSSYTMEQLVSAFSETGFSGEAGAERHFMTYGQFEHVDPNPLFNATEYIRAKAVNYFQLENPKLVTDLQFATIKTAIAESGMSPWSHYTMFGTAEGINASNAFNTVAYMEAKLAAMNGTKPVDGDTDKDDTNTDGSGDGTGDTGGKTKAADDTVTKQWTMEELQTAFSNAGLSALQHFMMFGGKGEGEVAEEYTPGTIPEAYKVPEEQKVVSSEGIGGEGVVVALTSAIDLLTGTAGDDVYIGDAATGQGADHIDGGEGTDEYHFIGPNSGMNAGKFIFPELKSVEKVTIDDNNSKNVDLTRVEGLKTIEINRHDLATNDVTVMLKGQHLTLNDAIVDKAGGDKLTIDSEADTVLNMSIKDLGALAPTAVATTTLDIAGTKIAEASFEINGKEAALSITNTGDALTTLNLAGDSAVTINSTIDTLQIINASKNTGGVDLTHTVAGTLTFTGGTGNDRLDIGAKSNLDTADKIDFGEGENDTLAIDAKSVTEADAAIINGLKGLDVIDFHGVGVATGLTVDTSLLTANRLQVSSHITGNATFENLSGTGEETIILSSNITATGANTNALNLKAPAGDDSNTDAIVIEVKEYVAVLMGKGNGAGINADGFEILTINVEQDLTSTTETGAASTVVDTVVGTHAKITVAGEGDVDLGLVATKAGATFVENNTHIDATGLDGIFSVQTGAGKDTISVGASGSNISAGKGGDVLTLGEGADVLTYKGGDSGLLLGSDIDLLSVDTVTNFTAGVNGDVLKGPHGEYTALDGITLSNIASASSLAVAVNAAFTAAFELAVIPAPIPAVANQWTAFTYKDNTYAVYDDDGTYDNANSIVINLSGTILEDLTEVNFAA